MTSTNLCEQLPPPRRTRRQNDPLAAQRGQCRKLERQRRAWLPRSWRRWSAASDGAGLLVDRVVGGRRFGGRRFVIACVGSPGERHGEPAEHWRRRFRDFF